MDTDDRHADRHEDEGWLRAAAFRYLERYSASVAGLRAVLDRKLQRRRRLPGQGAGDGDRNADLALVERITDHCCRLGLVDDDRYAEGRASSSRRKGRSTARIRHDLAARGVSREIIDKTVQNDDMADLLAALVHARKRRIGPWRAGDASHDPRQRTREASSLARAGFSMALVWTVLGMDRMEAESRLSANR